MNRHGQLSDRKRSREDNPKLPASPDHIRSSNNKALPSTDPIAEPNQLPHIFPNPNPRKKKRNKEEEQRSAKEQGAGPIALQTQVCQVGTLGEIATPVVNKENKCVQLNETNKEELAIAPMLLVQHPVPDSAPSKKKRDKKKKIVVNGPGIEPKGSNAEELQLCNAVYPATSIGVKPNIVKEIRAGPAIVNAERASVCSKHEPEIPIVLAKKQGAESNGSGPNHESVIPVDAEKKKMAGPNQVFVDHSELLPLPNSAISEDTPRKKKSEKKKKNLLNSLEQHPDGGPKHESVIPVDTEKKKVAGPNEVYVDQPVLLPLADPAPSKDTPCKKKGEKKKKNLLNGQEEHPESGLKHESVILADAEKKRVAGPSEVSLKHSELLPVPDSAPSKDTPCKKKSEKKKKNLLNGQEEHPESGPKHESVIPADAEKKNVAGPNEVSIEHPELLPLPYSAPSKDTPRKKKGEKKMNLLNSLEQHPESGPKHEQVIPVDAEEKNVAGRNEASVEHPELLNYQGVDPKGFNAEEHRLCKPVDPVISIGVELRIVKEIGTGPDDVSVERASVCCSKHEHATPIVPEKNEGVEPNESSPKHDPAIPVDAEMKEGAMPNEASSEQPELLFPVSDSTLPKDTPQLKPQDAEPKESDKPEHPQVCSNPKSAPSTDCQHVILHAKERRRKKRNRELESEEVEPNKQNCKPPEIPVQRSICPIVASQTDQAILKDRKLLIDPATPTDPEQKMEQKMRRKKSKSTLKSEGSESDMHKAPEENERVKSNESVPKHILVSNEASSEHPELLFPVSDSTLPKDTLQLKPQEAEPKESDNPEHPQVCFNPKSALSIKAEPNKQNCKLPEILVQRSICPIAASQTILIDQKLSIDRATPTDPERKMGKKKRRKKSKSALKSEGSDSDKHKAESTAKSPVQRTKGFEVTRVPFKLIGESSVRKHNAKLLAKTQTRRTAGLGVTKTNFKRNGESSTSGHQSKNCQRQHILDCEEICFFCGEIGHSLGKCSVSKAGGGRFARCLFCYGYGHFTNKCPQNGHGIYPKVDAANGPIHKTVEN